MKARCTFSVIASLFIATLAWAAANLNLSKSNINRYQVVYDTEIVSPAQMSALHADLDKLGPADEAKLKRWLPANFKRHGVQGDRIKKIVVLPASKERKAITILLLKDAKDEAQAIATTVKSGKSNSSD